jgi:hypothetical protein
MAADDYVFAIGRRRRQLANEFDGGRLDFLFQAGRKMAANDQLALQSGREAIFLGQSGRQIAFVAPVPVVDFVTIVAVTEVSVVAIAVIGLDCVVVIVFVVPSAAASSVALSKRRQSSCEKNCERSCEEPV